MSIPDPFMEWKTKEEVAVDVVEVGATRTDTNVSTASTKSVVDGWPTDAQRVGWAPLWMVVDLLLLIVPSAFIGKDTGTTKRHC
jgi:hypothetical protein